MALKDLLLHLETYPDPCPVETVDQAVGLCAQLATAATAVCVHVQIPLKSNRLAEMVLHLSDIARDEELKSLENAEGLLARFRERASGRGIEASSVVARAGLYEVGDRVAQMARTRDICVVAYGAQNSGQKAVAEAVIFGSGRPVVIFQAGAARTAPNTLAKIVIAWDGGRQAARAVADAMPILAAAAEVRILTVLNDKPSAVRGTAAELSRHLSRHGVSAAADEVDGRGSAIGDVVGRYLLEQRPDLLVMGAYGHSRAREFVLGGATQSILDSPAIPVLLSH